MGIIGMVGKLVEKRFDEFLNHGGAGIILIAAGLFGVAAIMVAILRRLS